MIRIERLSEQDITFAQGELVMLLKEAVDGGASMSFIAPLDYDMAANFWAKVAREVTTGERIVLAAYADNKLVGSVQLVPAPQPNAPHRAEVQKLLVLVKYRQQGIATLLLHSIEETARALGHTLIVLDTVRDSPAERLYEKAGYQRAGIIPQFAFRRAGELLDTVIFYRLL